MKRISLDFASGANQNSRLSVVASRFTDAAKLLDNETALLRKIGQKTHVVSTGSTSIDFGRNPFFILSGWLCRSRTDEDGNRAILEFLLPGDLVWPSAPECSGLELTVEVLADAVIAPAASIIDACKMHSESFPGLKKGLTMYADLDRKYLLDQVGRLIQMDAPTRLHALIVEFHDRLKKVGLSVENSFACPLSQSVFADATGLSTVHTNRSFGALTRAGLITRTRSLMTIHAKATSDCALDGFQDAALGYNAALKKAA
jgi:CRP-like cAMP-binding protein